MMAHRGSRWVAKRAHRRVPPHSKQAAAMYDLLDRKRLSLKVTECQKELGISHDEYKNHRHLTHRNLAGGCT